MSNVFFSRIAGSVPQLGVKLKQAGLLETPEDFVKKTFISAFYTTTGVMLLVGVILVKLNILRNLLFIMFPILFVLLFSYLLKTPEVIILRKQREIEREIVFAGRFLIIELESGVSVYQAMKNVTKNYEYIGNYFKEITDRIDLGTTIEDALNESIENTPSANFRKLLWQILNSLKTGADLSKSLGATVDQIVREQTIEVREYGRKLNPFAMFYMMIAVILPSIGIIMIIILSSFLSIKFDLSILVTIAFFIAFIQFMFFSIIRTQRPSVEI